MKKIKKLIVLTLAVGMLATSVLGTSAAFDPVYYAKQNPDVVKVLGDSPEMLKLHYDLFGRKEARMSNTNDIEAQLRRLFRADEYAKLFPDVQKAFGDDKEAMFQHYIAFGLLEGRRPSEKVSQDAANSLKKSVEKAMTDAKIEAKPGSAELVKVITGEIQTTATTQNAAEAALQTALTQVAEVVTKAVTETVQEVNKPVPSAGGDSSSGGSSFVPVGIKVTNIEELKKAINDLNNRSNTSSQSENDYTIALMNDINMGTESLEIKKQINLNLYGHTLTSSANTTFTIKEGGTLQVASYSGDNGVIKNTEDNATIVSVDSRTLFLEYSVTLDAGTTGCPIKVVSKTGGTEAEGHMNITVYGTLKGKYGIYSEGDKSNGIIEIAPTANIYAEDIGIYQKGEGRTIVKENDTSAARTVNISGKSNGIKIEGGTLEVGGGTITSTGTSGAALTVLPGSGSQATNVTIKGGIFKAQNGGVPLYVKGETDKNATVTIPADSTAKFIAKSADTKAIQIESNGGQPTVTDSRSDKNGDVGKHDSDPQGSQTNPDGGSGQNGGSGSETPQTTP